MEIQELLESLGLSIEVGDPAPFFKDNWAAVEFKLTLNFQGKAILSDLSYKMGVGHFPLKYDNLPFTYKNGRDSFTEEEESLYYALKYNPSPRYTNQSKVDKIHASIAAKISKLEGITPSLTEVMFDQVQNYSVLDFSSFEEWAEDYGYDPDSRKGEKCYKECLRMALALRNALGEDAITKLREAYQDY
jgi:hypothetical protein